MGFTKENHVNRSFHYASSVVPAAHVGRMSPALADTAAYGSTLKIRIRHVITAERSIDERRLLIEDVHRAYA
jgi:hypothetical protein